MQKSKLGLLAVIPLAMALSFVGLSPSSLAEGAKCPTTKKCHSKKACHSHKKCCKEAGNFKTFHEALRAAGLMCKPHCKGNFTVFAPDNAAFAKLPKADREALFADKKRLKKVLEYHMVARKLTPDDLGNMRSVKTVEGEYLMLNNKDGQFMADGALVTKPVMKCGHKSFYEIDEVLFPKSDTESK